MQACVVLEGKEIGMRWHRELWYSIFRWFRRLVTRLFEHFVLGVDDDNYVPRLVGMRPLENGRLALAFNDDRRKDEDGYSVEEVRIFDFWTVFADRRQINENDEEWRNWPKLVMARWFDPEFFKTAYLYMNSVCWGEGGFDLHYTELYDMSVLVKEDFQCVK